MVTLRWSTDARTGVHGTVTLVELVVENPAETATRIRVGNRLDGPVWPPRREGVPESGWDDGGFESVVAADSSRSLGYASPAAPEDPPVEVVWTERAGTPTDDSGSGPAGGAGLDAAAVAVDAEATVAGAIRSLGDPRPPADAVAPLPDGERSADDERSDAEATSRSRSRSGWRRSSGGWSAGRRWRTRGRSGRPPTDWNRRADLRAQKNSWPRPARTARRSGRSKPARPTCANAPRPTFRCPRSGGSRDSRGRGRKGRRRQVDDRAEPRRGTRRRRRRRRPRHG
ncbi:hypothetical protein [Halomicrococcus sp. NG-SE-24]|uniref:DUF7857 domain-containing protein n=1 Tax=Halomicrococcus sp. NG-SE-24 TaxID=3436928 RepID=UPI003D9707A8